MIDLVAELRKEKSPEACSKLMLWAATVIEKDRQRFIERVERIDKLEAENAKLRERIAAAIADLESGLDLDALQLLKGGEA